MNGGTVLKIKVFPNGDIVIKKDGEVYETDQFKAPEQIPKVSMTDAQKGALNFLHNIYEK